MDESRKQFEQWFEWYTGFSPQTGSANLVEMYWQSWKASREAISKDSIVAYQDSCGNVLGSGDFDDSEVGMHETAFYEGWTPLVRAAGIKVKE
jgi:hypothetical protein